jgi:hypothetical protein
MPRNTRNFWVDFDIDGRQTSLEGGPVSKTGGLNGTVYVRGPGGSVQTAVRITGEAFSDGELRLYVTPGTPRWSDCNAWPEGMKIEPYELDGGGFGFRIVSHRDRVETEEDA